MDNQEPPFSLDFPPEIQNSQPTTQNFSNEASSSFSNEQNHSHATKMEKFRALFSKFAVSSSQIKSLSPMQRSIIDQRLHEFFPDFHTPDHPPYAAMIETAIGKLNEEGGSTEEAISNFIRNEYPDLPRAHDILLTHHLQKLCKDGCAVKAGNRFSVQSDLVTDHNRDQFFMLSHVATCTPVTSPTPDVDAESSPSISPSSSPSWCSSTSYGSFTSLKRKCSYVRRQERGRKKGRPCKKTTKQNRIHLKRARKKRRRPHKKDVVEEENEVNADILMLEEAVRESDDQSPRKEVKYEVPECHIELRRRGQRRKEQGQRQLTMIVIETDLNEFKGMVNEEWMGQQPQEKLVIWGNNQAEDLDKQTEVFSQCDLQQEAEVEVVGQEDQLNDGQKEVTTQEDTAKEENQVIVEETFLEDTKIEVISEQSLLEEYDIEVMRGERKEQTRRARTCKRRKVHQKRVPERGRGRPRKKDLLVEETQSNAEKTDATKTQNLMLQEKTAATEDKNELNKEWTAVVEEKNQAKSDGQKTFECSQAKETHKEIEIGKPAVIAEENESEMHNLVMEERPQTIGGIERCDEPRKHEHIFDKDHYELGELKNEVSEEQNKPRRQQNGEQRMQIETNIKSNSEQEVEVAAMQDWNPQIEQKIHLEGEHKEMTKRLLAVDDAESNINSKATMLPTESSSPMFEEKEEEVSKKNMEWKKVSPGEELNAKIWGKNTQPNPKFPASEMTSEFESVVISPSPEEPQQLGPMFEDKEEISKKNIEQKSQNPRDEGNIEINGKHTQQKPEFSSSELSQPEFLQQPQQAEEMPRHQKIWHRLLKTFSLYGLL